MRLLFLLSVVAASISCAGVAPKAKVAVACEGDQQVVTMELEQGEDLTLKTGASPDCPDCEKECAIYISHE